MVRGSMAENLPFASASESVAPVRESGFVRGRETRDDGADGNKASAVVQVTGYLAYRLHLKYKIYDL